MRSFIGIMSSECTASGRCSGPCDMHCGWRAKHSRRYWNGGDSGGTLLTRSPRAAGHASGRASRGAVKRFEHKLGVRGISREALGNVRYDRYVPADKKPLATS